LGIENVYIEDSYRSSIVHFVAHCSTNPKVLEMTPVAAHPNWGFSNHLHRAMP